MSPWTHLPTQQRPPRRGGMNPAGLLQPQTSRGREPPRASYGEQSLLKVQGSVFPSSAQNTSPPEKQARNKDKTNRSQRPQETPETLESVPEA